MSERTQAEADQRELLLRVLPMSASLAGLCIAGVTLFRTNDRLARKVTLAALTALVGVGFLMVYPIL